MCYEPTTLFFFTRLSAREKGKNLKFSVVGFFPFFFILPFSLTSYPLPSLIRLQVIFFLQTWKYLCVKESEKSSRKRRDDEVAQAKESRAELENRCRRAE